MELTTPPPPPFCVTYFTNDPIVNLDKGEFSIQIADFLLSTTKIPVGLLTLGLPFSIGSVKAAGTTKHVSME